MNPTAQQLARDIIHRSLVRFVKGFVSGGVASIAMIQPPLSSDPHAVVIWGKTLFSAFIVGGILSVEKLLTQVYGTQEEATATQNAAKIAPQGSSVSLSGGVPFPSNYAGGTGAVLTTSTGVGGKPAGSPVAQPVATPASPKIVTQTQTPKTS